MLPFLLIILPSSLLSAMAVNRLGAIPGGDRVKKESLFKNNISPPKIRPTPPAFGRIYLRIHLFSVVALSGRIILSIAIFDIQRIIRALFLVGRNSFGSIKTDE